MAPLLTPGRSLCNPNFLHSSASNLPSQILGRPLHNHDVPASHGLHPGPNQAPSDRDSRHDGRFLDGQRSEVLQSVGQRTAILRHFLPCVLDSPQPPSPFRMGFQ